MLCDTGNDKSVHTAIPQGESSHGRELNVAAGAGSGFASGREESSGVGSAPKYADPKDVSGWPSQRLPEKYARVALTCKITRARQAPAYAFAPCIIQLLLHLHAICLHCLLRHKPDLP